MARSKKEPEILDYILNTLHYTTTRANYSDPKLWLDVVYAEAKYAKYVYVEGFPKGYVYEDFYELGATGVKIEVGTQIIPNTGSLANKEIALGDVMYDFTLTTVDGKEITLSELFANGKKAVVLNFWYTTCTYCIEEFPYLQAAYEKYQDEIELIGINAYPTDNNKNI